MTTPMTRIADNLNATCVSSSLYPMAHLGHIWETPKDNSCIWEIVKIEESHNRQIAYGLADSVKDAQDAMQGVMRLWVSYGQDYTADEITEDVPPPPMGFAIPNMD